VTRAQAGDSAALEETVRAVQDDIFDLSLRMLGDADDARDASQEVLVNLRFRRGPRGLSFSSCRRGAWRANAVDRRRRVEHARGMGGYRNRCTAFSRTGRQNSVAIRAPELAVNRRCVLRMQHNVGGTHLSTSRRLEGNPRGALFSSYP